MAFRLRAKRQENPEAVREIDRSRRQTYVNKPGKLAEHARDAREDRENQNAAGRRRNARVRGVPVPKQRQGAKPIYLKQICRISASCPLAIYCVDKVAAGQAVLSKGME